MGVNDAREQLEVAKAECARLEGELESVRRLHEVATERTVQLAAVIERAADELPFLNISEASADTLRGILAADTDAVLRERDAEKFAEGQRGVTIAFVPDSGRPVRVFEDNPYREGDRG